ncbi:LysE family translocator [Crenobacter sp. SG2303]|uniref:LysE family translocator n=1 Tax=Crenobacter oryzisoli TaxID=3056844 RepID=A0ABT7XQA2_9NEIS|nr:LysE family translocator [Crenobacter sp. SG2303]MDN0075905.1 LysE family translocator [Crenobacter sp. SG2303]
MPDIYTLALFASACLVLAATPGPDMLLIASRSVSQGRGAGFASLAGIQLGTYCHALAAALGLSQLFLLVPVAYDVVRLAGAAYLLFLAWKTVRADGVASTPDGASPRLPLGRVFRQGLLTNLLNPKMALFVLALFPQFVKPGSSSLVLQMLLLATVLNLVGLLVNGLVILTASRLRRLASPSLRYHKLPQYLLGSVFAALACRLAFASRH